MNKKELEKFRSDFYKDKVVYAVPWRSKPIGKWYDPPGAEDNAGYTLFLDKDTCILHTAKSIKVLRFDEPCDLELDLRWGTYPSMFGYG